jgi:hypothetical protein
VTRLLFFPVTSPGPARRWRVSVPDGAGDYRHVTFKRKALAEAFHRACKRELAKCKRVDFLTNPRKLLDALEAFRILDRGGVRGFSRLRRAAALMVECEGASSRASSSGFEEPASRGVELPPALYRVLRGLAHGKDCSLEDLVTGVLWQYARGESERRVPVIRNEEKTTLYALYDRRSGPPLAGVEEG